jgi:hypothetical protein
MVIHLRYSTGQATGPQSWVVVYVHGPTYSVNIISRPIDNLRTELRSSCQARKFHNTRMSRIEF